MRRRRAYPALFAVVLLLVGQLAALAHNAEAKHVVCSEHGEELEAATLVDELDDCEHSHWIGVDGEGGGDHEECAIARALHQSTQVSRTFVTPAITTLVSNANALPPANIDAAIALYLIAPKTSPPA